MIQFIVLAVGPLPPTSTLGPHDIIHVMDAPRPSPFFAGLQLLCTIVNANQNGGGLGTRLVLCTIWYTS